MELTRELRRFDRWESFLEDDDGEGEVEEAEEAVVEEGMVRRSKGSTDDARSNEEGKSDSAREKPESWEDGWDEDDDDEDEEEEDEVVEEGKEEEGPDLVEVLEEEAKAEEEGGSGSGPEIESKGGRE